MLRKLAHHLQYDENDLFTLAGYLTSPDNNSHNGKKANPASQLDPQVARVLAAESPEVQRAILRLLPVLKNVAKDINNSQP
ncbi:MAG: hypothetical protein ACRKGH_04675 [Dehalogenimonas sp.]